MKFEEARVLAGKVVDVLRPLCDRVEIAGSIRRERAEVNDIDMVAIPKADKWQQIPKVLFSRMQGQIVKRGEELITVLVPADPPQKPPEPFARPLCPMVQVDVYRAREETWGVILLVRTGSKEHNVKLCSLARSKGLKLSASEGVVTLNGSGQVAASKTEEEIFQALGLPYVHPRYREVSE